jgi:microcin C transport system substrate-binding protein
VDTSQYQRRQDTFDFDVMVSSFPQSLSPGNEQRDFWGSAAANKEGSHNLIGIKNSAIDTLIDKIVLAKDRADLAAATRALDRVLLWSHYVVPQWRAPTDRIAIWDMFGRPGKLPSQTTAFFQVWWYDAAAAKRLSDARG